MLFRNEASPSPNPGGGGKFAHPAGFSQISGEAKKIVHSGFVTFPNFYLSTSEKIFGTGDQPGHRLPVGQSWQPMVGKIAHPKIFQ